MGVLAGGGALAKDEKPQKDSKEVQTAKKMHIMFTQQMGVHNDLELQEYVQRVGEKLAAVSERPELEWHFTIVDTDDVNAFATMGGYVYISRGIIPYFENEADLAAVLGHEIGHISAEHLKKQQHKGMLSGLASAATAIFTGMPALADLTNMAGQAIISGYGREAELEADRLGASYLAKAGYDPEAMIHVISTLKDQDVFERERARAENREPHIYHGTFASHPDNDTRLQQAIASAGKNASAATGHLQNAEGFLKAVEGLPIGSSARQGMVRDNRFYHADMGITIAFPRGWHVDNERDRILAYTKNKDAIMQITTAPRAEKKTPREFLLGELKGASFQKGEELRVNGMEGYTVVTRHGSPLDSGEGPVRWAVLYRDKTAFLFGAASRSGTAGLPADDGLFVSSIQTLRSLKPAEYPLAEPYRIHVIQATDKTKLDDYAKDVPVEKYKKEELEMLNGLYPNGKVQAGQSLKIVE
jgi:predicted Zn-dependent protease